MVNLRVIIRTVYSRFIVLIAIIVAIPFFIVMVFIPARIRYENRFLFWGIHLFYWVVIKAAMVPILFEGKEGIPDESVIFVANHQSALDIPLLGYLMRNRPHVWLARQELLRWKLLRWVLPRLTVIVDTQSREKAMRSMITLMRLLEGKHVDLIIFPEGARFPDDKVHRFFGGFVTLAKLLKRKVVPVYISGVNKVYPPDTFWVQWHPIKVIIGKPFVIEAGESDEAFKQRVYYWFLKKTEE